MSKSSFYTCTVIACGLLYITVYVLNLSVCHCLNMVIYKTDGDLNVQEHKRAVGLLVIKKHAESH